MVASEKKKRDYMQIKNNSVHIASHKFATMKKSRFYKISELLYDTRLSEVML